MLSYEYYRKGFPRDCAGEDQANNHSNNFKRYNFKFCRKIILSYARTNLINLPSICPKYPIQQNILNCKIHELAL